jgi:hypothetical protein
MFDGRKDLPMPEAAKFTLRFQNQRTHDLLGEVADQLGVSKNRLAEEMLERELETAALLVELDLDDTLRRLRSYRRDAQLDDDVEAFAEGEAFGEDPLRAQMVEQIRFGDAFGVMESFGS